MLSKNKNVSRFYRTLVLVVALGLAYSIGSKTMDGSNVEELTKQMRPVCVGRFLIDLPAEMDFSYSHTFLNGFVVATIVESQDAFLQRVATREAEINAEPNERGGKNMEKVELVRGHGFTGKIFKFGRTSVEGVEDDRTVQYVNVALEGYVHSQDTTFTFRAEAIDPDRANALAKIIDKLRVIRPRVIPTAPGFCFGRGMLIDPVPIEWTEGVAMFAGFPRHPDLALVFNTRAGLGKNPNDPGRLARNARADAEMPLWQKPLLKKLRIGVRNINGIDGEEVLEKGTELNFVQVFAFDWEVAGTKEDPLRPSMHLEMSTGHPVSAGSPPVLTFLGDEALVQLWDKISASIRVRPTGPALAAPAPAEPPAEPLPQGPISAGDVCPWSGWWKCSEANEKQKVLGGPLQYIRKGQRMPQALLLRPQTTWDKIRGVQSSYELAHPSTWVFADQRSRARVEPPAALAPAGAPADPLLPQTAPAKMGDFIGTGEPCPASGWWQCVDSAALDGVRWFARGEVFPAATFQRTSPKFQLTPTGVTMYLRRSTWKLVRQADNSNDAKA
jgi:hypothetical protein